MDRERVLIKRVRGSIRAEETIKDMLLRARQVGISFPRRIVGSCRLTRLFRPIPEHEFPGTLYYTDLVTDRRLFLANSWNWDYSHVTRTKRAISVPGVSVKQFKAV